MATSPRPRRLRLAVIGCLLSGLLVVHVAFRYLAATLFGVVTYRGLPPVVPWLVSGTHVLLFVVLAVSVAMYRGRAGAVLGAGLLLLSVEPLTSAFIWGDGCDVGGSAGATLLPAVTIRAGAVVVYAWNGACSTSLNIVLMGTSVLLAGGGLWRGRVPDETLTRWLALVERYGRHPSD